MVRVEQELISPETLLSKEGGEGAEWGLNNIEVDDTVSLYLREAGKEPLLTHEEEVELAKWIETGRRAEEQLEKSVSLSPEERTDLETQAQLAEMARLRFVRANTRLVISIAKKYWGHGVPFLDLIQEGNIGLMRAVEKFEYRRGCHFSTYASWWIKQAISRALIAQGRGGICLPVHANDELMTLVKTRERLYKELGFHPSVEQLAEETEFPSKKVRLLLQMVRPPLSLDQPVGEDQENFLGELIEDEANPSPEERIDEGFLLPDKLAQLLGTLNPREERVLRLRYGLQDGQEYTLEEIGEKFGLSRERIRQIEKDALIKLRHPRRSRKLRDYI